MDNQEGPFSFFVMPDVRESVKMDLFEQGVRFHQQGDWKSAVKQYLACLKEDPFCVSALHNIGLANIQSGLGMASIPFFLRAVDINPAETQAWGGLLYGMLKTGREERAGFYIDLARKSGVPQAYCDAWVNRMAQGVEGELPLPEIISGNRQHQLPDSMPTIESEPHCRHQELFERVLKLNQEERFGDIIALLSPALKADPVWGEGWHLLGVARLQNGEVEASIDSLRKATEIIPGRAEIWDHYGLAWARLENFEEIHYCFERSLSINPLRVESWANAASSLLGVGAAQIAYQFALQASRIDGGFLSAMITLGMAAKELGNIQGALNLLMHVKSQGARSATVDNEIGSIHLDMGDYERASEYFRQALVLNPDNLEARSNEIFVSNYLEKETQSSIYARALGYGNLLEREAAYEMPIKPRARGELLRIGLVSGDLRQHPVGYFLVDLLRELSRRPSLAFIGIPTSFQKDEWTESIRACCTGWLPIGAMGDKEAACRIRDADIDILIDLSGHTGKNRLGVFARKSAPVQVTWLGYFGTTGVKEIDYLLAGPWDIPPEEEGDFVEQVWRLPSTRLCFSRPSIEVEPGSSPADRNGFVTFGCFNNIRKLSDSVIRAWVRVLIGVDGAMLKLKAGQFKSDAARSMMLERFAKAGLAPSRLIIEGPSPRAEYLATYNTVDIVLDPFPYTGGTTTVESLWMGAPVLTLRGDRFLARQGESMLRLLGMDDWVGQDVDDYVNKAIQWAGRRDELAVIRRTLRARVETSPLMDAGKVAADLEAAFRGMWAAKVPT